jgi:polyisoprenoid-binding protein YceI
MKRMLISIGFAGLSFAAAGAPIHIQKFDTNHSTVAFRVPILGEMSVVEGKFTDFTVDLTYDEDAPASSSVFVTIHPASVDTGIAERDKHLRSADFFDVAKYPDLVFESSRIEKTSTGFIAHGKLTMHGVTKEIALPFRVTGVKRDPAKATIEVAFAAETHLNRRDYGINWTHSVDPLFVGDDIPVSIHLLSKRVPVAESPVKAAER